MCCKLEHGREKGKYDENIARAPKIIQILITPNDLMWQGILVGLGDDGITYQVGTGTKWEPMIDALTSDLIARTNTEPTPTQHN